MWEEKVSRRESLHCSQLRTRYGTYQVCAPLSLPLAGRCLKRVKGEGGGGGEEGRASDGGRRAKQAFVA